MHIDSALRGVAEDERCPGWQTGNCPLPLSGGGVGGEVKHTCPDCGMEMQASSDDFLVVVVTAHKKTAFLGQSQCQKKLAGKI
mmetsp:Transcript_38812/g.93369  ORF Transcript_38812/g.93369 Transcript_38812/m.93369 type:complete len:83 (+) Transcript_38812:260-508(+)